MDTNPRRAVSKIRMSPLRITDDYWNIAVLLPPVTEIDEAVQ